MHEIIKEPVSILTNNSKFKSVHGMQRSEFHPVATSVQKWLVQITLDVYLSFFVMLKFIKTVLRIHFSKSNLVMKE